MSPVAISADKRFRRAHVKPARTRRGWRALMRRAVLSALTVGALLYSASYVSAILAQAQVLRVNRIVVHGNERLSNGDVLAVLSGLRGESLIWTDLDRWRHRLLASPWIRDAAIRRVLPSTVEIVIAEREPVGIGRIGGAMYLIDGRGAIIDEFGPQYSEFDLPIVDGLAVPEGADTLVNERRGELASRVISALRTNPVIFSRLSQVDVHDLHNASVILSGDPTVIQLGEQDFLSRLRLYLEMAPSLHERMADIESVDLRFEGRIYARPTGKRVKAGMLARRAKQ